MMAGEMMAGEMMAGEMMAGEMMGAPAGSMTAGAPAESMMAGSVTMMDSDLDGVFDSEDNCVEVFNPEQSDIDQDGEGDACEPDADLDGIPDAWDPAPQDTNWPGKSLPDTVYAHTSSELFRLDVKDTVLASVAPFNYDISGLHQMTDIAIDRAGVLWAISFNRLWLCHPRTGACRNQGELPPDRSFNGLTFLPGGLFMENRDVLVGIENEGTWRRFNVNADGVDTSILGSYFVESLSGDVFSIEGVGTYAAVTRPGVADNIIVEINSRDPSDIEDVAVLEGYTGIFGVAGWRGELFAFDSSGVVLRVDLNTSEVTVIFDQNEAWWGAGVSSVIYSVADEP
jgi:hypothetical protein